MRRLIWGFAGHLYHIVGNPMPRLILSDKFTLYVHYILWWQNTVVDIIQNFQFSPSTDIVSKFSRIYFPFALGLSTIKYVLNELYASPFIGTKINANVTVWKFDSSRKISRLNRTSSLHVKYIWAANNVVCATSKASDQPAHTCSLIRAFASRLSIFGVLIH